MRGAPRHRRLDHLEARKCLGRVECLFRPVLGRPTLKHLAHPLVSRSCLLITKEKNNEGACRETWGSKNDQSQKQKTCNLIRENKEAGHTSRIDTAVLVVAPRSWGTPFPAGAGTMSAARAHVLSSLFLFIALSHASDSCFNSAPGLATDSYHQPPSLLQQVSFNS